MLPKTWIHIVSKKFQVLSGERELLVNEGMFGKALAIYLQRKLVDLVYAGHLLEFNFQQSHSSIRLVKPV
jgi:hypothetical protein